MRIIAGEFGGRRIAAPEGEGTRPMLDRVRESVFGTLGDVVEGARVLDLYAGSGSLGLEALSRGALHVRFVERGKDALEALRTNVEALGVAERVRIVRGDALARDSWGAGVGARRTASGRRPVRPAGRSDPSDVTESAEVQAPVKFGLVFFDPPYRMLDDPNERARLLWIVERIIEEHMEPGGVFVLHAPGRALEALRFESGRKSEVRTYGTSAICFLRKDGPGAHSRASEDDARARSTQDEGREETPPSTPDGDTDRAQGDA